MKKPKINLSKEGLKHFFLHHIEKLILGLAILGLGTFLWLGISTDKYSKVDSMELSQKADTAKNTINDPESWNKVADLRVAKDKAHVKLDTVVDLEYSKYKYGKLRGTPIQSRGLRLDPDIKIAGPIEALSENFRAPVFITSQNSKLNELDNAFKRGTDEDDEDEESKFGDQLTNLQSLTPNGIQPSNSRINPSRDSTAVVNMVSVRALINHEKIWNEYEAKLKNSFGYYPERDHPTYQVVEIQRKLANSDQDWTDVTVKLLRLASAANNSGATVYSLAAPEVVAPENYDAALTGFIPPIAMLDYRPFSYHPNVARRSFDPKKMKKDDESQDDEGSGSRDEFGDLFGDGASDTGDPPDDDADDQSMVDVIKSGSDRKLYDGSLDMDGPASEFKVIRFFDILPKSNAEYVYRFRVWVDDPNNEFSSELVGAGGNAGNRGGRGNPGLGGPGMGGAGGGAGAAAGGGDPGGGRRGGAGGGSAGPGEGDSGPNYKLIPITDSMKDITVRNRIDDEKSQFMSMEKFLDDIEEITGHDLRYSRATEWTEIKVNVPVLEGASAIVGNVSKRQVKNAAGRQVSIGDSEAEVLVCDWSSQYDTLVPMHKEVSKGDFLSAELKEPTSILHIADQTVKVLKEYRFRTNRLILDLMGGEEIGVPSIRTKTRFDTPIKSYNVPGEVLIMDLNGNFKIQNASEDREDFLDWRFQEDETSEFNKPSGRTTGNSGFGGGDDGGFGLGGGRGG